MSSGRRAENAINSTLPFQEVLSVELTEVSDDEAPVCAQWNDEPHPGLSGKSAWNVMPGGETTHVRFYGGRYWRPMSAFASLGEPRGDPVCALDFAVAVGEGRHKRGLPLVNLKGNRYGSDSDYFDTLSASDRALAIQTVESALGDLLVVDGLVYERCLEPMIVMKIAAFDVHLHDRGTVTVAEVLRIATDLPSPSEIERVEIFPVHRFREALGKSRRANATKNQLRDMLSQSNAAKEPVLLSEYFLDEANAAVSDCAIKLRQFLSILESKRDVKLPFSNRGKIRLVCDLGDTLDDLPNESALDAVETLGMRYLELYGEQREWTCPEQVILKQAIAAAATRTVNLAIDFDKNKTVGPQSWRP